MSAAASNGAALEHARFRRACLDALAAGPAFALDVHLRMRERGYDVEDLRVLHAQLVAFEQTGLVEVSAVAPTRDDERPRKRYALTPGGIRERARLGVP